MDSKNIEQLENINVEDKKDIEFINNLPEWDLIPPIEGVERTLVNDIL